MQTLLQEGQVVVYNGEMHRVAYVNSCRARIVPLKKKHVTLTDGREFDAERGGFNISPNSTLRVVTNVEAERDAQELRAAEAEIRELKNAVKRAERAEKIDVPAARARLEQIKAATRATKPVKNATPANGGWYLIDGAASNFRAGSLASTVLDYITINPGQTTAQIVAGVGGTGAVAACVSRFNQSGLIEKIEVK